MDKHPPVHVIVLNWNGRRLLHACLTALAKLDYPSYRVSLVDNNSTDDSVAYARRTFPDLQIIENEHNYGYAGGNNRALHNLDSDFAVLVNPDIVVAPDWLTELIVPMHADKTIGIAGCKLLYPDQQTIQHAGGFITHPRAMPFHQGMHEKDIGQYESLHDVEYVTGAAIAIRRQVWEKIGFLDEGFFMYFEEADWCARARAAGFRVVYVPQATAIHDESAIAVKGSLTYLRRFHTSRWRYLVKHFDPDEIISATFPAEEQWLLSVSPKECLALKKAYRMIHTNLDDIIRKRVGDGGGKVSTEKRSALESGLIRLRMVAISQASDRQDMELVGISTQIQKPSFQSGVPIIGFLIARLRSLWASVAANEQAKIFTVQQSEFNRQLIRELEKIRDRMAKLELELVTHDEKQVVLKRQQAEIEAALSLARQQLETIEQRLGRIADSPQN